jgi:hypothetical protein
MYSNGDTITEILKNLCSPPAALTAATPVTGESKYLAHVFEYRRRISTATIADET